MSGSAGTFASARAAVTSNRTRRLGGVPADLSAI